jgi:hypothetical protein
MHSKLWNLGPIPARSLAMPSHRPMHSLLWIARDGYRDGHGSTPDPKPLIYLAYPCSTAEDMSATLGKHSGLCANNFVTCNTGHSMRHTQRQSMVTG